MDRRRAELAERGIDFRRAIYHPGEKIYVQCEIHKCKTFVQHLAGLLDGEKDSVLDVKKLHAVAQELAREDRRFYPLEAALERHTDMQGDAAMAFFLICPPFLERLLQHGYDREYVILEAVGMGFAACDMPHLTAIERTRRLELIRAMLGYNVIGEALYIPGVGEQGVRSTSFQGLAAPNLLAFLANADARAALRDRYPAMYRERAARVHMPAPDLRRRARRRHGHHQHHPHGHQHHHHHHHHRHHRLVEITFQQKHVESYHSELAQQLGYKPSIRMIEPRARKVRRRFHPLLPLCPSLLCARPTLDDAPAHRLIGATSSSTTPSACTS